MDDRLIVIGIIVGVIVVYMIIASLVKLICEKLEEKAVDNALAGFDLDKAEDKIKSIARKYLPDEYKCPITGCNGILVVRSGRYGEFLGCNRYPDCTYTKSI